MSPSDDSISRNAISGQSVSGGSGGGGEGAPTAPSGLTAEPQDWAIILSWTPGTNIANQRLERSPNGLNAWEEIIGGAINPGDSGYADDIPGPNLLIDYRVVNLDSSGNPGLTSNIATALTYPGAVADLAGTPAPDSITLTWTAPTTTAAAQRIERSSAGSGVWAVLVADLDPALGTYADESLPFSTAYDYRITTSNISGERTSGAITVATLADPAPVLPPLPILPRARWHVPPRPSLHICDAPPDAGGTVLFDATAWLMQARFSKNRHGDRDCTFRVRRAFPDALALYLRRQPLHVEVVWGGQAIWEGRITDPTLVAAERSAFSATALGYWHATTDTLINGVWSDTRLGVWTQNGGQGSTRTPIRYTFDQQYDLTISLKNGAVYTASRIGGYIYRAPDLGMTSLTGITGTALIFLPTGYSARLARINSATSAFTTIQSWSGTGAQIGPVAVSASWGTTGDDIVLMEIFPTASATYTGGDGDAFFSLINPRVFGGISGLSAGTTRDPAQIVRSIRQRLTTQNPTQLLDDDQAIQTVGVDRRDAVWEDMYAQDVLAHLAAEGDGTTPWDVGVGRGRQLFFRPRREGKAWGVIANELELAQNRAELGNAVYATYEDSQGRTRRTPLATDALSIARFGVRRERMIASGASNLTDAQRARDTAIGEWSNPRPTAGWTFRELRTLDGMRVPGFLVEPGDTITEIGITPAYDGTLDRERTFAIAEMAFDLMATDDPLSVVPESPPATLDRVIADIGRNS